MQWLRRFQHLPRDARDTVFLLGVIAWLLLPKIEHLPVWCVGMAAGILVWRGWLAVQGKPLPSRWWIMGLLVLATLATFWSHRTLLGRDAGVTFLVVLLALKTLELRARRDAFVIFFLGFFTLLSNFFFSQGLLTAASMLVGLLGLLTALVLSHMTVGRPTLAQAARTAGTMALLGAPIMAVLFVLFPRIAPLWGLPGDAMTGRSGLSGTMQVGSIAELALDSSVAMRIKFEGPIPQSPYLYFRGPVLSTFDGREWRTLRSLFPARARTQAELQVRGEPVRYQVTLEGNNRPWLPVLDATRESLKVFGAVAEMGPDLQWRTNRPLVDTVRFTAASHLDFQHGPMKMTPGLQDYLVLPEGFNPRTQQLGTEIRTAAGRQPSTEALIDLVLERLRTGGYRYTLEPGLYGTHTADEFWFDRKAGFCEHIASSFVLLMRTMDVPARIVTGYQGGELNGVDGYWTIRQSDAHAWAEVWIANRGWVRVDPTAAVSPGRVGTLTRLQAPQGVLQQALGTVISPRLAINLRQMWEAANERWNQWVLNYSQARQLNLLRNLGIESPSWEHLSYVLLGIIVFASGLGAAWAHWERRRQDPWLRLLQAARARLAQAGLRTDPSVPARALAEQLLATARLQAPANPDLPGPAQHGQDGQDRGTGQPLEDRQLRDIHAWLLKMEAARYAAGAQQATLATLREEFRHLPWPKRLAPPSAS